MTPAQLPGWLLPTLGSALALGVYDLCKKHAVRDNSVMPVLFFATLTGSVAYLLVVALSGGLPEVARCTSTQWWLLFAKSLLVGASWTCVYYAMRELPISLAAPIRATAPLWTFFGSLLLFNEFPSLLQAAAMVLIFLGYYRFSVLGKLEGFSFRNSRGVHLILIGTLLGAAAALYDKYLLNTVRIPPRTVQFWFSINLVVILGAAFLLRKCIHRAEHPFHWRWTIPATGLLLILADYLYFYAVSLPEIHISVLSLVRRCSCVVTFFAGFYYFRDTRLRPKALALGLILLGVLLLALAK